MKKARLRLVDFRVRPKLLERQNAVPVDPTSLSLIDAVAGKVRLESPRNGLPLFGAIRDAMPDSFGRRVIENQLQVPTNSLPESEYLQHAGSNRFGALDFRPERTSPPQQGRLSHIRDLDYLRATRGSRRTKDGFGHVAQWPARHAHRTLRPRHRGKRLDAAARGQRPHSAWVG